MMKNSIILAGGLGTRLRPLTDEIPKPLLPIGDKPILERIIENMTAQGIENIFISVNYKKDMIKNYFKDGKMMKTKIKYIEEERSTGTAGCLTLLPENFCDDIIVSNGDLLSDVDYNEIDKLLHVDGADFVLTTIEKSYKIDFGVINSDESTKKLIDWVEKPTYTYNVNAGIYGVSAKVIKFIKNNFKQNTRIDMPELWKILTENNFTLLIYKHPGDWYDIGRIDDYVNINSTFSNNN
ncbi:MAG TPA: sugar phosphate nucleotidyltransferase [Petrotogaceae bacterium]|nr:sugar phosphate nucleotidyltransferase [Petrotogaceae bacterium]